MTEVVTTVARKLQPALCSRVHWPPPSLPRWRPDCEGQLNSTPGLDPGGWARNFAHCEHCLSAAGAGAKYSKSLFGKSLFGRDGGHEAPLCAPRGAVTAAVDDKRAGQRDLPVDLRWMSV